MRPPRHVDTWLEHALAIANVVALQLAGAFCGYLITVYLCN